MLKNYTPHTINIQTITGEVISLPSLGICRVTTTQDVVDEIDGVEVRLTTYGAVEGLPAPEKGVCYIVSLVVLQALASSNRFDCVAPDTGASCIRENGQIKAVTGFVVI